MKAYMPHVAGIFFLIVLIAAGCGRDKYREAKEVMDAHLEAMKTYVFDIERAESPKKVAESITAYSRKMKELIPEIKKMNKEFPELLNEEKRPEEMKEMYAEMKEFFLRGKWDGCQNLGLKTPFSLHAGRLAVKIRRPRHKRF